MLEQHLNPEEFTDDQIDIILKALFRRLDTAEMLKRVKQSESQINSN